MYQCVMYGCEMNNTSTTDSHNITLINVKASETLKKKIKFLVDLSTYHSRMYCLCVYTSRHRHKCTNFFLLSTKKKTEFIAVGEAP